MKSIWNNGEDLIGVMLKFLLKWVALICSIILIIAFTVFLFNLMF